MELQEIHTKYKLKIADVFGILHTFNLITKKKLRKKTSEDLLKAVLNNISIVRYFYETNTLIIYHKEGNLYDITIKLDSMDSKQTQYVIMLRNFFYKYGVQAQIDKEARNLMDQYFCIVIPMLFRELTYR